MNARYLQVLRRVARIAAPLVLTVILVVLVHSALASPRTGRLTRVTLASHPNRDSNRTRVSADGTRITFRSDSDILGEGRPEDVWEVWLYDTTTLTFTRITSASHADRTVYFPYLSADGTVVAFQSNSDFLDEGRPADVWEIWLYDMVAMTYTRVTSASNANRGSWEPTLNQDGTVVAFHSDSDLMNQGIVDEQWEVWLYDTVTMSFTRVTSASHPGRESWGPSLSWDGSVVAFYSDSDLLSEGRPANAWEVWLYDTATMTVTRVTSASHQYRVSQEPVVSGDGKVIAFYSDSDHLGEGRPDNVYEIWLYNTDTLTFTRITSASHANRFSRFPSLNWDGTVIAFRSDSDFLNEGRPNDVSEIWLYDTATMTYTRITSSSNTSRYSRDPSISSDGTILAFASDSDFLNQGIPDDQLEVWLWEEARYVYLPLVLRQ